METGTLQELLAAQVELLGDGWRLVGGSFPHRSGLSTNVPDSAGQSVAVEIKRAVRSTA